MRTFFMINGATPTCTTDLVSYFNDMTSTIAYPVPTFVFGLANSNQGSILIVGADRPPHGFRVHRPLIEMFLKTPEGMAEQANGLEFTGLGRYLASAKTFLWECVCMEGKYKTPIREELRPPIRDVFSSFAP